MRIHHHSVHNKLLHKKEALRHSQRQENTSKRDTTAWRNMLSAVHSDSVHLRNFNSRPPHRTPATHGRHMVGDVSHQSFADIHHRDSGRHCGSKAADQILSADNSRRAAAHLRPVHQQSLRHVRHI